MKENGLSSVWRKYDRYRQTKSKCVTLTMAFFVFCYFCVCHAGFYTLMQWREWAPFVSGIFICSSSNDRMQKKGRKKKWCSNGCWCRMCQMSIIKFAICVHTTLSYRRDAQRYEPQRKKNKTLQTLARAKCSIQCNVFVWFGACLSQFRL